MSVLGARCRDFWSGGGSKGGKRGLGPMGCRLDGEAEVRMGIDRVLVMEELRAELATAMDTREGCHFYRRG